MATTTNNAAAQYAASQNHSRELLDQIREALEAHAAVAKPHWGHVGDLDLVQSRLTEVLAFLRNENH
jgi:hypothetical protein